VGVQQLCDKALRRRAPRASPIYVACGGCGVEAPALAAPSLEYSPPKKERGKNPFSGPGKLIFFG